MLQNMACASLLLTQPSGQVIPCLLLSLASVGELPETCVQAPSAHGEASTSPHDGLHTLSRPPTAGTGLTSESPEATQHVLPVNEEAAGDKARDILRESIPRMTGGWPLNPLNVAAFVELIMQALLDCQCCPG